MYIYIYKPDSNKREGRAGKHARNLRAFLTHKVAV